MSYEPNTLERDAFFAAESLRIGIPCGQTNSPLVRGGTPDSNSDTETIELSVPTLTFDDSQEIRVLHVDDQPQYTELTEELLERADENITVVGTTTVVEALNCLSEEEFDCVISDYDMPQTNGLEFLELVRESHPHIPFILFTGKGSEEIASEAIQAGVTDYIQKKGGIDQYDLLANRIRNAVERYRLQHQFWDALSWYEQLVEQNLTGVFLVQDGEFTYVNERFASLVDYCPDELVDESVDLLFDDETVALLRNIQSEGVRETHRCDIQCAERSTELTLKLRALPREGERTCLGFVSDIH